MAPIPDQLSAPGAVSYDSSTMTVGDGTWDFSKNTFLLPNLQGLDFETMRYNGMGNRFSTMSQYHRLVLAHAVMGVLVFLFILPISVMMVRFYSRRPGWAVKYHSQLNILAGLMLLAVFLLGYFAVGPNRSLTNPHHGIGVAIFVMFAVQILGGRLIRKITKARSLRVMIHQWLGRSTVLLGIAQVPLGMVLYGSPLVLFILYAVWMAILVVVYFILSYRSAGRRELYMEGAPRSEIGRSEVTHTRLTESEYFASDNETERPSDKSRWLGPLAAGGALWALLKGRKKDQTRDRSLSRSPSLKKPEVIGSRRGSGSYLESEKYSDLPPPKKEGGGFMRLFGGGAAGLGVGKLVSGLMNKRERRYDDEYSAVSTETPKRHRAGRGAPTTTDLSTELSEDTRYDGTHASSIPPSGNRGKPPTRSALDSRLSSQPPVTPRPSHNRQSSRFDESDYSSYVSPSRRPIDDHPSGGFANGVLGALGVNWFAKKMADRRARRDEERRIRDEEDMRSGTEASSRWTEDDPSPTKRYSRPPARRPNGRQSVVSSEMTESSIEDRPPGGNYGHRSDSTMKPPIVPVTGPRRNSRSRSRSKTRRDSGRVSMPSMPDDPRGILHESDASFSGRPTRRNSSRRRRAGDKAAAAAAARAGGLAEEQGSYVEGRERYASPHSAPLSVKLKVHDDKDRNVTLRRLTEEEAMAARGRRDSESSLSGLESPTYSRRTYRRDSSQKRAEIAAERRAEEEDEVHELSPPNPAFGTGRAGKDSAYYSGKVGHLGSVGNVGAAGKPMSSLGGSMASLAQSHGTWSEMSEDPRPSVSTLKPSPSVAADNRRRRRMERRRGSSASRPTGVDMYD